MDNKIIEVRHLSKSFGSHEVLKDIDFAVDKGDVISIIGASGKAVIPCMVFYFLQMLIDSGLAGKMAMKSAGDEEK